jgi:hypothetical protein
MPERTDWRQTISLKITPNLITPTPNDGDRDSLRNIDTNSIFTGLIPKNIS